MTEEAPPPAAATPSADGAAYAPPGAVYTPPPIDPYAPPATADLYAAAPASGYAQQAPAYASPQGPWQGQGYPAERPGRTIGIVGFILSFLVVVNIAALVVSIVGLVKSRRAGQKNGFALAGLIISIVGVVFLGSIVAVAVPTLIHAGQVCSQLGNGVHVIGNSTYTCTPTSFNVSTTQ
jgi:hypothetical protein